MYVYIYIHIYTYIYVYIYIYIYIYLPIFIYSYVSTSAVQTFAIDVGDAGGEFPENPVGRLILQVSSHKVATNYKAPFTTWPLIVSLFLAK